MGAIIAEKLAQEGADVAVIYAGNEEKANAVSRGNEAGLAEGA